MTVTVRFEDFSERVKLIVQERTEMLCEIAAEKLTETYSNQLSRTIAPPHSRAGRTPHAYNGWARNGYGPVNDETDVNNIPPEFSAPQTDFLYTYLRSSGGDIGFLRQGHVTRRVQNYLIRYSTRTDKHRREWVVKEYRKSRKRLAAELLASIRQLGVSDSSVPF